MLRKGWPEPLRRPQPRPLPRRPHPEGPIEASGPPNQNMSLPRFFPAALILDMDGLMVDSEPLWFDVERAFAQSRGGSWTSDSARACVGRGLASTLAYMHENLGLEIDPARDAALVVDAFIARVGELALEPGLHDLLADARGRVPLAVASSSAARLITAVLARFDLAKDFAAIVSGEAVAHPEPSPTSFFTPPLVSASHRVAAWCSSIRYRACVPDARSRNDRHRRARRDTVRIRASTKPLMRSCPICRMRMYFSVLAPKVRLEHKEDGKKNERLRSRLSGAC